MISKNLKARFVTSLLLLSIVILIFNFNFILTYCLIVLGVLSILEFLQLTKRIFRNKLFKNIINFFFIGYIFIFCFLFFFFSNFINLKILIFIILFGCIASDLGGFIFGKIFKGPKLTKISPNKTYSGAIGSLILTIITISLMFLFILKFFNYNIILIALIVSISCQLGDLVFSYLKRKANIKDTGNFLPGHGGVLDRLDGIFFGMPIGYVSLILII